MLTAIGLYMAACVQPPLMYLAVPHSEMSSEFNELYDVSKLSDPEARMRFLIEDALNRQHGDPLPYMPNSFKKGDPVPYMPGAGEPLINREEPIGSKMRLIGK